MNITYIIINNFITSRISKSEERAENQMLKGPELGARRAPANLLPWPESRPYRGARVPSRPPVFQVTLGLRPN